MKFEQIVRRVEANGEIPTIGPVAAEVLRLAGDPDVDFSTVGEAIAHDPALAARVLRVANSPLFGLRGEVASVGKAVGLLGLAEVRNIVLSVSVIRDFSGTFGGEAFNWERFWEHSAGVGLIARALTRRLRLPAAGLEYTAGLLHDVGKILFGHHFPEDFARALSLSADEALTMEEAERRIFGTDHGALGRWLAERWGFPEALADAIACHHHPRLAGDHAVLAACVQVADQLAKAKCIGFGGDVIALCLSDSEGWGVLEGVRPQLGELDLERFTYELDHEVGGARDLFREARGS